MTAELVDVREGYIPIWRNRAYLVRKVELDLVPERLRDLLRAGGLTPPELARRIEVNPSTVTRWMAGRCAIPAAQAVAIAELLKVRIEDFCYVRGAR